MPVEIAVFGYIAFTTWRLLLLPKKLALPTLRGPEWFFHLRVSPQFYPGEGGRLLRRYRLWLLAPYALEVVFVAAVVYFHRLVYLYYMIFPAIAVYAIAQVLLAKSYLKKVRGIESVAAPEEDSGLALSLETRRLRNYTSVATEIVLGAGNAISIGLLTYVKISQEYSFQEVFLTPALLLYVQAGIVLIKHALVLRRGRLPASCAESHLRFQEEQTSYWMRVCDWPRALCVLMLVVNSANRAIGQEWHSTLVTAASLTIAGVFVVLAAADILVRMNRVLAMIKTVKPIKLTKAKASQADAGDFALGGLVYYNPDNPALFVKHKCWLAPNLANRRAYLWAAYLGGLVVFGLWSKVGGNG